MPQWKQFSGNWTVTQAAQAKGAGTWPLLPGAPTIGTATPALLSASVAFTAPANPGYPTTLSYTVTSSPGSITASGSASPITVSGLTAGTSYTFTVTATNDTGTGPASAASNSVVPLAPTELYAWGRNNVGQLGINNSIDMSSPVQVGALTDWSKVKASVGDNQAIAIKTDGTLWSWGNNFNGQLGRNNQTNYSSPVQVGSLTTWLKIASGTYSQAAIQTDGGLWAWGINNNGLLGVGDSISRSSPIQIGYGVWSDVSIGTYTLLAVKGDGTLWASGNNQWGVFANGTTNSSSSLSQSGSLTNWGTISISKGQLWAASVKTDGTLWTWGYNAYGNLGISNTIDYSSPVQVGALTNWSKIEVGALRTPIALKTDGTIWTWGDNTQGQMGVNNITGASSPVQVGALSTWMDVSGGGYNQMATKTDGTLWTWGKSFGNYGVLGQNNTTINLSSPVQVGSSTKWLGDISMSESLAFAIKESE